MFIKNCSPKVGEKVITTKNLSNFAGYMKKGSEVTVIGIGERGYSIEDDEGNKILECGWDCIKCIK